MFRSWFGKEHEVSCYEKLRPAIEHLYEKPKVEYLFLDFDIHDAGDSTLREWLRVPASRRELDGLDLAYYVAKRLPPEKRPDHVVIHSRNPIGRKLMSEYLERKGLKSLLWAFDYEWTGLDGTTKPSPKPVKSAKWESEWKEWEQRHGAGAWWEEPKGSGYRKSKKNGKKNGKNGKKVREPEQLELTPGLRSKPCRFFPVGTKVRLTGSYLEQTGGIGGPDARTFTVQDCPCVLCLHADYVAIDEEHELTPDKLRHIGVDHLFEVMPNRRYPSTR